MDKKEFFKILEQPNQLKNEQIFELEEFIQNYPYFQAAKVIYLKALKKQNSFRYNQNLKTTAIYTTDRSVLFDFITSDDFNNPMTNLKEKEIIEEIELRDEMVIKNIKNNNSNKQEEITNDILFIEDKKPSELLEETANIIDPKEEKDLVLDTDSKDNTIEEETPTDSSSNIEVDTTQDLLPNFTTDSERTEESLDLDILKSEEPISKEIEESIEIDLPIDAATFENTFSLNTDEGHIQINENILLSKERDEEDNSDNQESTIKENTIKENTIDNAFFYGDKNLDDIVTDKEEIYIKPEKEPKSTFRYNDEAVMSNLDASDEIYRNILNNPSILEEEEFIEKPTKTDTIDKPFIFEIAKDETIESVTDDSYDIDINYPSTKETSILFEPLIETKDTDTKEEIQEETITITPDVEKPVTFKKNESHSFNEWLQLSSFKPIDRSKPTPTIKDEKADLIDKFMTKNPKIIPDKNSKYSINVEDSDKDDTDIMTETLARVYTKQHKYDSAIKAYEILSLKFPEKSSFFADQIKMLQKLKRSNYKD